MPYLICSGYGFFLVIFWEMLLFSDAVPRPPKILKLIDFQNFGGKIMSDREYGLYIDGKYRGYGRSLPGV